MADWFPTSNSRWASEAGHRYLETIRRCLQPDGAWDLLKFDYARHFDMAESDRFLGDGIAPGFPKPVIGAADME